MVCIADIKKYWGKIDSFFERCTPKNDTCKMIEEKIRIPLRYVIMTLTLIVICILHSMFRDRGFYTYSLFAAALIKSISDLHDNAGTEKKWAGFWFIFACFQMLPGWLDHITSYTVVKLVVLIFFAFFDDCTIILEILELAYVELKKLYELYLEKFCVDISNVVKTD